MANNERREATPLVELSSRGRLRRVLSALVASVVAVLGLPAGHALAETASSGAGTGASFEALADDAVVLHVDDRTYPEGTTPNGSVDQPYPSLAYGVAAAQWHRSNGRAVHLLVAPGTYRESVSIPAAGANPPLLIEGQVPGEVILSGADVETSWSRVDGTRRFTTTWTENWGLASVPTSWDGVNVNDAVRRREAVLVDGKPLAQVLEREALTPGTFMVDEESDELLVEPPATVEHLDQHLVEVAKRSRVLHVRGGAANVAIRGLVFEAGAAPFEQHMVYVSDARNVLFEGNDFRHSSWGGLGVCCTQGVTVRDNQAVSNGGNGIDTFRTRSLLMAGNHIAHNNLRGARNGFVGWSVAGSKHLHLHDATFRDNVYFSNYARGLWFDTDVQDVLVDGDRSCNNMRDGIFIEAVQGPLTIQNALVCNNPGGGVLTGTSGNVAIVGSTIANNGRGQLIFNGDRQRSWTNHVTGERIEMGDLAAWTLTDNRIESSGDARLVRSDVIPMDEWKDLLSAGEITAQGNTWTRPSMDGAIWISGQAFPMSSWRSLTDPTQGTEATTTEPESTTEPAATSSEPDPEPASSHPGKGNGRDKDGSGPKAGRGGPTR